MHKKRDGGGGKLLEPVAIVSIYSSAVSLYLSNIFSIRNIFISKSGVRMIGIVTMVC